MILQNKIMIKDARKQPTIRRISTILFLLMLSRLIYSQEYYKFPTSVDLPVWGIKQTIHDRMEETETISYFYYTMIGDTIIEDNTYDKVYQLSDTLINAQNIEVVEQRFTRDELYMADECFLTGTAAEITPVREVDDRQIAAVRHNLFDHIHLSRIR